MCLTGDTVPYRIQNEQHTLINSWHILSQMLLQAKSAVRSHPQIQVQQVRFTALHYVLPFNTSPTGNRERPPDELNKVVELLWFYECDVWSELTGVWRSRNYVLPLV